MLLVENAQTQSIKLLQDLVIESKENTVEIECQVQEATILTKWPNLDISYNEFIILKEFQTKITEQELISQFSLYKGIIKYLRIHIYEKNDAIFYKLYQYYLSYFTKKYSIVLTQYPGFQVQTYNKIMFDLKLFSGYFANLLLALYQFDKNYFSLPLLKRLLDEHNLKNLMISLIFESPKVSEIIQSLQIQLDKSEIQNICEHLSKSTLKLNGGPQDFGIPFQLCLNSFSFEQLSPQSDNNEQQFAIPYEEVIKMLNDIPKAKNPLAKFKQLMDTGYYIKQNIMSFYKEFNQEPPQQIGQDDAVTIYIYLFVKSDFKEIFSHCNLIEQFVHPNIKSFSIDPSFSYFTIRSCIDYIQRSFK